MADYKFIELVFEFGPISPAQFKAAHSSLARNPQQLFALLVEKEISTEFLSDIETYGRQLARLLDRFPDHSLTPPEDQWKLRKDGFSSGLLEETLRAFLFLLLANGFPQFKSQQAMADIIMAVVNLSKPGSWELIREKLGEVPGILKILIADGRIGILCQGESTSPEGINSNAATFEAWARIITDITSECTVHRATCQSMVKWEQVRGGVRAFRDCQWCQVAFSDEEPDDDIPPPWDEVTLPRGGVATPPRDPTVLGRGLVPRLPRDDNFQDYDPSLRIFESLIGSHLGPWKIVLSAQALRDLTKSANSEDFSQIQKKLFELAAGEWTPRFLIKPTASYQVPVFKTFYKANAVILWQVDVAFDERPYCNFQVVKVWGIGTHEEITHIRDYIIRTQQAYTKIRVAACKMDSLAKPTDTAIPAEPPGDQEERKFSTTTDRTITEGSPFLAKFYSLTTTVLDAISSGVPTAVFPLDVSAEEVHIIDHFKTPAFILGRSGTGKTTCLIYKLTSRYLRSKKTEETPVRQLLLTRSKNLAQKLKLYTKQLIDTQLGGIDSDFQGDEGGSPDTMDDSENDTTQRLLSLGEQDFPLVCTFNYFLRLLENTIKANCNDRRDAQLFGYVRNRSGAVLGGLKRALLLIEFTTFRIDYWRRFPARLTKGISEDLAYMEIMGVIKASVSSASNLEPLSRDAYLGKRWKAAPSFATDNERDAVYSLYENYERMKKIREEIDDIDRVINVVKVLNKNPELQRRVEIFLDEVYVDEVQDQRPPEIELLLSLIRNPEGIHFAGDTAQSISKDSLFRFANAKTLFYTRFSTLDIIAGNQTLLKPTLLPLSKNFRSHQGILFLASFVMKLLYTGFPNLVDKLPHEVGELHGPKPTLCVGSGVMALLKEAAGLTERDVEAPESEEEEVCRPECGELRVILVRDTKTRDELRGKVNAIPLTILQSKGMEFEDVFLYNFFTTGSYNTDFKILEKLLHERHSTGSGGEPRRYADWEKAHIALCSELKNLYVGVTRVRSRLWILESEENAIDSVISLFNKTALGLFPDEYPESLIEVVREHEFEDAGLRERFYSTKKASPAQWGELAHEFMTKKDFYEANFCFNKANDKNGGMLARAYLAELKGMEYRASGLQEKSTSAFKEASRLFNEVGRVAKAAGCQEAMGDYAAAAKIWSKGGIHEEAAWLFIKAGEYKRAADEYQKLGDYEKVLAAYLHGSQYDELTEYLNDPGTNISATRRIQYSRLCYRLLIEEKIATKLRETVIDSLGPEAQQESFFRRLGMLNDVFKLFRKQERYKEAYEIGVNIGLLEDSLQLLIDNSLLEWVSPPSLAEVFNYLQAGDFLTKISHTGGDNQTTDIEHITAGLMNDQLSSIDKLWKSLDEVLNGYPQSDAKPDRTSLGGDGQMRVFLDLLVTSRTPEFKVNTTDVTKLPLEFINGAINVLWTIAQGKTLPPPVQLYFGIFGIRNRPQNYIALQWSPLCVDKKLRFPIQPLDDKTIREEGYKQVLSIISRSLTFIGDNPRATWGGPTLFQFEEYCNSNGDPKHQSTADKPTTAQLSTNMQDLIDLNLVFSGLETVLSNSRLPRDNPGRTMTRWPFWPKALLRQMTFVSSYEQDAAILIKTRSKLKSSPGLYGQLQKFYLSEVGSVFGAKKLYLSSLLQQLQVAISLDVEDKCIQDMKLLVERRYRNNSEFNLAFGAVTHARKLRTETRRGDFPGLFCENIRKFFPMLGEIRRTSNQLSFYSPSVLSLYEELILLLILLIRPTEILIPRSWEALHLSKWTLIPRSTSRCEIWWYQRLLIKIVVSFCELMLSIEDRTSNKPEKTESLARRSLNLLVTSIINVGTLKPPPSGYTYMWKKAQEVFSLNSLKASEIKNVPAHGLVEKLAQAFTFYGSRDSLIILVMEGNGWPDLFAGLPLEKHGIVIRHKENPKSQARHLVLSSPNREAREINAAYLITRSWRTNGPKFVQKMKVKRQVNAAYTITRYWRAFVQKMKEVKAAYLITQFWRAKGPKFVQKMKVKREQVRREQARRDLEQARRDREQARRDRERAKRDRERVRLERVYLARLQKLRKYHNCCMLAEMKYGNDWIF